MNIKNDLNKVKYYFRRYGFAEVSKKVFKRIFCIKENRKTNQEQYKIWMQKNNLTSEEIQKQKEYKFEVNPKISIVVPMYNTDKIFLKELIESLEKQTYSNWELCLADGSENQDEDLKQYYEKNEKIKYKFLNENKGISENTNAAIEMVTGEYIGFLDHDDLLSVDALFEMVKVINDKKEVEFIYSDEDKIDEQYERFEPYFKPDYSPETLACNNYITHFVVVKKELVDRVGKLNSEFNGAQDFDFVLRATKEAKLVVHISKVLYHWRVHKTSTANVADAKPYAYEAGLKAVESYIDSLGRKAKVANGQDVPGIYKIKYEIEGEPKVSILIPNKDNVNLLRKCIDSILKLTTYKNYEIVVIENNSNKKETLKYYTEISQNEKVRIINSGIKEFNYSKIINFGVKNVDGEFIIQLNNDTKILTPDWIENMVGYAQNKEIGAVGARLYYEDKTIQHAGIIIGISGIAGNMLVNLPYGKHAYFGREAAIRNVAAVTGACLMCRRELYEEVGFMDEENFKVAFNDVDLCLKFLEKGYRNVYNPYVELIHYESKSRGYEYTEEQEKRFKQESEKFKLKWKKYIDYDPYYNINFSRKTCNYDIDID